MGRHIYGSPRRVVSGIVCSRPTVVVQTQLVQLRSKIHPKSTGDSQNSQQQHTKARWVIRIRIGHLISARLALPGSSVLRFSMFCLVSQTRGRKRRLGCNRCSAGAVPHPKNRCHIFCRGRSSKIIEDPGDALRGHPCEFAGALCETRYICDATEFICGSKPRNRRFLPPNMNRID